MKITRNETIGDQPIIDVRRVLRRMAGFQWEKQALITLISEYMKTNHTSAKKLFAILVEQGYINHKNTGRSRIWETTIKGNSLAMASAAKPILRKTADKIVTEFLERVRHVNENEYFLYKVKRVLLFGSYLGTNEKLGDIDIAVELVPKEEDLKKNAKLMVERARDAVNNGRRFSNFTEELFWAVDEVRRYLKSRSRSISLHDTIDPILKEVDFVSINIESGQWYK